MGSSGGSKNGHGADGVDPASSEYGDADFIAEEARRMIVPGFRTLSEVRELMEELVEDDEDVAVDLEAAMAIVEHTWRGQLVAQSSWHGLSDADRLQSAFVELEASGVVARMNFTCCQNCGAAEIDDEVPDGAHPRGYVFFHQQDAENLADGSSLSLSYGAFSDDDDGFEDQGEYEAAAVEIGRSVVRALAAAGLEARWDGTLRQRICLTSLDWRRRLPT